MGGMETYSKELSDALKTYVKVETVVLPGHADGSVPGAWELLSFGFRTAFKLLFGRKSATITHVADMASWPLAMCARIRNPGGRQVLSAHGTDVSYPLRGGFKGRLYGSYLRVGAKLLGSPTIVANSAATAEAVRGYGFGDTVVVPLAAKVTAREGTSPRRSLLFCGRLIKLKGCAWFINEVLPLLPKTITLDVAGTAWDEVEASALNDPRVNYLGRLDQNTLWNSCAGALCVVVPNIDVPSGEFEGFGLVALEAAAAGGLVLASRQSGLKDAVIDGETGFLLPPGNAEAWAEKIREVLNWSEERRGSFVVNATEVCARRFTWDRVAIDTVAVYGIAHDNGAG